MKTPSSRLYDLIKSLTSAERRYFKLYVSGKDANSNKYVQLFDAIVVSDRFDDEHLARIVYGGQPVETRKYSELKSYLYELVIRSLQSFDEKTSVDYRLKNQLLGVRALFKRSHFEDCKAILAKVKKTAAEYEDFKTLVEVLDWEKKIAYTQTDIAFLDKEIQRITDEEKMYLENQSNISAYRNIFFNMLVGIRKDVSRNQAQKEAFARLMENPLMADESMAHSFNAKVLFFRVLSIYHFSISNFEAFHEASNKLLDLMEQNVQLLKEDVSEYISALSNHIISCGRLGKMNEVRQTLDKLNQVEPITLDDELKIHRQYFMNKFSLCIKTGEFEEGERELQKHFRAMDRLGKQQFAKSGFYIQYFCIYFGVGKFNEALSILNEWLKLPENVERKDLQSLARILNLIIHFELGNTILLESLLRSTYRYLSKKNRFSEFEKKIIDFIRMVGNPQTKKEIAHIIVSLKQEFETMSKQNTSIVFDVFDIIAWLESKISAKPFSVVVKEQFIANHREVGG